MKKIVVLQGVGEIGKSTTIGIVRDLFVGEGWEEVEYIRGNKNTKDFAVIVEYNSMKLGICTWGDNVVQLELCLPEFCKGGCKFIVCAMRTRGGTVHYVEKFAKENGYVLFPIKKSREAIQVNYDKENRKVVAEIFKLIKEAVSK